MRLKKKGKPRRAKPTKRTIKVPYYCIDRGGWYQLVGTIEVEVPQ